MKRILITPQVQAIADDYLCEVVSKIKNDTIAKLNSEMIYIRNYKSTNWKLYVRYIKNIIRLYDSLVTLHPKYFKYFYIRYFSFSNKIDLGYKGWCAKGDETFYNMIERVMGYATVRDEIIVPFIKRLGIRTCVNCNSEYILSVNRSVLMEDGNYQIELKGRFQLDHFWAKSKYPFLSISFFNLQPSCGFCNLWKRTKDGKFNLYTDFYQKINPFSFILEKRSLLSYLLNMNKKNLNIELKSKEKGLAENHKTVFCIEDIYKFLNDETEEIIWKAMIYNKSFLNQLRHGFKSKFSLNSNKDVFRFLYGFYPSIEDVHKRPLTKMKQDIAKQLKLV